MTVDQWGWDSKEMSNPLKNDMELMDSMAHTWARPIAQGYLPQNIGITSQVVDLLLYPSI